MARRLMPTFAAQNRPQDVYVHLIFELLPAGMIGIIVAALFSATMATVSADLNAIAGVLTKDFYQRLLRPGASESGLVAAGRLLTLLLGTLIIAISMVIAASKRDSLFQIMVTAFGILLAPTLLPLLAALVFPALSSKGVIAGLCSGLAAGVATFTAKVLYLAKLGPASTQAIDLRLEGYSIFCNIAVTCFGLYLGSTLLKTTVEEQQRTANFFLKLKTPITANESSVSKGQSQSSALIIRLSTLSVGILLITAGLLSPAPAARGIDCGLGVAFLLPVMLSVSRR
jgi:Na+/proline symporter